MIAVKKRSEEAAKNVKLESPWTRKRTMFLAKEL